MKQSFLFSSCCKGVIIILYLFLYSDKIVAQVASASYNTNSIPINGNHNSAFGSGALNGSSNIALRNSAFGYRALYTGAIGGKLNNAAFGYQSLYSTSTGSDNAAHGYNSLYQNSTGNYNTGIGGNSLYANTTGQYNTALGYNSDVGSGALTNATSIGYGAIVNNSNSIQLGNSSVTTIYGGVGTTSKFITGMLQVTGGSPAVGKVLTSDASGNATWQTPGGGGGASWLLSGNSGTIDGTDFIGTVDNIPFNIRVNNQKAGRLDFNLYNSFYGVYAGNSNSTGTSNTAIGYNALFSNTSTSGLTAVGYNALYSNGTGVNNTATGYNALQSNNSGYDNTAMGNNSLYSNTSGVVNTGIGSNALYSNLTGIQNVAVGYNALYNSTAGALNIGIGYKALYSLTGSSSSNIAVGGYCLDGRTSGEGNTAMGWRALAGSYSGDYNTAIGYNSLNSNSGSFNTTLGYESNIGLILSNSTAIGNSAFCSASNQVRIGNPFVTSIGGYANWTNFSDGRFKKNINENVPGLEFIKQLRPVTYNLDITGINEFLDSKTEKKIKSAPELLKAIEQKEKIIHTGFIAQEVEAAAKKMGYDFSGVDAAKNEKDLYGLRYSDFIVPLVKAVQELSTENDILKKENEKLQSKFDELDKKLLMLESLVKQQNGNKQLPTQSEVISNAGILEQNHPNPFNSNTLIRYNIPLESKNAEIVIANLNGVVLKKIPVSNRGMGQIVLTSGTLASGTYIYTLIIDGRKADTKQMILTK